MKTERNLTLYIQDMLSCIKKILDYIEYAGSYQTFIKNDMIIDAVTRNYEIIGEIANKIPKELKEQYPTIPWRQMYGLRNLAIHEYHVIDNRILWEIATEHLVDNYADIEQLLEKLNTDENKCS